MSGFRFRPPPVERTPAIEWSLARAFGPAGLEIGPVTAGAAIAAARALDLSARIATRATPGDLERELGGAAAAELARDRATAAALALRLDRRSSGRQRSAPAPAFLPSRSRGGP